MKVLLLTNHFDPEEFRCNDIAYDLAKRGHEVKVLTGIPYYPFGQYYKGYSLFKKRYEKKDGVTIVRVPLIPSGDGGKLRMVMNYSSSLFFFLFYALYQALFNSYDCIYIHNTSPAFICIPAVLIKKIKGTPIILWTLDMWPESLVAGGIKGGKIYKLIGSLMKRVYKNCAYHHISSLGFRKLLEERGVNPELIEYLPNWSDDAITSSVEKPDVPPLPEGFKIMFAGNLGEAQNLENVLAVAKILKDYTDIHWIFLGDGRKKPWMESFINDNDLQNTVHLLGRYPLSTMPAFFEKADVMLVSLCDEMCFNLTLPAKVQAYMSCKKPVLGFLNGEGQYIINLAKCGYSVDANDTEGMAKAVLKMANMPKEELNELGNNGYQYYGENFARQLCIDKIENAIRRVSKKPVYLRY